jgi:hypothetical protein
MAKFPGFKIGSSVLLYAQVDLHHQFRLVALPGLFIVFCGAFLAIVVGWLLNLLGSLYKMQVLFLVI